MELIKVPARKFRVELIGKELKSGDIKYSIEVDDKEIHTVTEPGPLSKGKLMGYYVIASNTLIPILEEKYALNSTGLS